MFAPVLEKVWPKEKLEDACQRAVREECGLIADKKAFEYLGKYTSTYDFDGQPVQITTHMYVLEKWLHNKDPENREPEKHKSFQFLGIEDLRKIRETGVKLSDAILCLLHNTKNNVTLDILTWWKEHVWRVLETNLVKYRDKISGTLRIGLQREFYSKHYGADATYTSEMGWRNGSGKTMIAVLLKYDGLWRTIADGVTVEDLRELNLYTPLIVDYLNIEAERWNVFEETDDVEGEYE